MDVMLWILIGLAGGLSVAALAPEMAVPTRSAAAWRRVRGAAAGLVGAVAVGYALVLADSALRADRLTAGLGALTGALWFAGIAEAYASRRRRGEESVPTAAPAPGSMRRAREMPAYDAAREALVAALLGDAAAHEAGRYSEIGRGMPKVRAAVARQDPARTPRLQSNPVPVTADNFTRAESDSYFANIVKSAGGIGRFLHRREVEPIDKQIVIRANRDTLYSAAIVDLDAGPARAASI